MQNKDKIKLYNLYKSLSDEELENEYNKITESIFNILYSSSDAYKEDKIIFMMSSDGIMSMTTIKREIIKKIMLERSIEL